MSHQQPTKEVAMNLATIPEHVKQQARQIVMDDIARGEFAPSDIDGHYQSTVKWIMDLEERANNDVDCGPIDPR